MGRDGDFIGIDNSEAHLLDCCSGLTSCGKTLWCGFCGDIIGVAGGDEHLLGDDLSVDSDTSSTYVFYVAINLITNHLWSDQTNLLPLCNDQLLQAALQTGLILLAGQLLSHMDFPLKCDIPEYLNYLQENKFGAIIKLTGYLHWIQGNQSVQGT